MQNKKTLSILCIGIIIVFLAGCEETSGENKKQVGKEGEEISLPTPEKKGDVSLEEAIDNRRSAREYKDVPLEKEQISQILWAAQGTTDPDTGYRAAPSAGATYPLEVYVVVDRAKKMPPGVYNYNPRKHSVTKIIERNIKEELAQAVLGQAAVKRAPVSFVITAVYERVTQKYDERGKRYARMEAGHVAQNIYLQSTVMNLGTVSIGAFEDGEVAELMQLREGEEPLYIMPVGKK